MMSDDLLEIRDNRDAWSEKLSGAAVVLHGRLVDESATLMACLPAIMARSPFRHLYTPGGHRMSVAMSNCGRLGWVSDRRGYRYQASDPLSGQPWPAMPRAFHALARDLAGEAGYPDFDPDVCLVNRYEPGARLSLHQDKDEHSPEAPIVSFSFGLPAVFLWGGSKRSDKVSKHSLRHGDVAIWGGCDRFRFHGVAPLGDGEHRELGRQRINITFRQTGLS